MSNPPPTDPANDAPAADIPAAADQPAGAPEAMSAAPLTPEQAEREKQARDRAARERFIAFTLFRLSGIAILLFSYLILLGRFSWVQGEKARMLGAIFACVGLFQTIVIPRILARAFRTRP